MTSINSKMGLRPAGKRARLNALSGVACPTCQAPDVRPVAARTPRARWFCAKCGESWEPTFEEIRTYNGRVRERDRI
jgi:transposase-like protein